VSTCPVYIVQLYAPDEIVCNDPTFSNEDKYYLTREEALDRAMEKSLQYIKICKERNLDRFERSFLRQ